MTTKKVNELTNCEMFIMAILWDFGDYMIEKEIENRLRTRYGLEYAETTVYTFLKTLCDRGYVEKIKRGTLFFKTKISKEEYLKGLKNNLVELFGEF